ncbi:cobalamin biosynthesis protein [Ectopseudomonas mendocina]|uniref:Cobalamin biosynthesis protein CbiG n=1 Tax=Ectopseudomonas mendocina TaxID=300 RepID=A0A2R3QN59_ECTME|nr:cobalamin biosynthesis protein [Pseudomonas mendocina]AVO53174.1 cobalamin biosynthesis protein CbiG [Pseudomonas mendocina]
MTASHLDPPATAKVVAGLGCRRGCAQDELLALLTHSLAQHELTVDNLAGLASIAHKHDEPALHELATCLKLKLSFFTPDDLMPYQSANTASLLTRSTTGAPAVAEPCALALATRLGSNAQLLGLKKRSASATCALATFDREPA